MKHRVLSIVPASALLGFLCLSSAHAADDAGIASRIAAGANSVVEATKQAESDLARLRADVLRERSPLSSELSGLQLEVSKLRRQADRTRMRTELGATERAVLEERLSRLEEEERLITSLLVEYRRGADTRMSPILGLELAARLKGCEPSSSMAGQELVAGVKEVLAQTVSLQDAVLGGMLLNGIALDQSGREHTGRFALIGPVAYFLADGGGEAGMVVRRAGSALPGVATVAPSDVDAVRVLLRDGHGTVPVDVTGGDALRVEGAKSSLADHARRGGVVMIPLAAVGLLALGLASARFVALYRMKPDVMPAVQRIVESLAAGRIDEAVSDAGAVGEPFGDVLLQGVLHRTAPREHLEEILNEHAVAKLPLLERHLAILAVLGGVAPLLGLLGTVTGMIHTFQLVTIFGTGDAKLLSGGISEALVTTEFGLVVAIPVLLMHAFLARRVRVIAAGLERASAAFVNGIVGERG